MESRGTPVARTAASFQDSTRPSGRVTNMPSSIEEMTPRRRSSDSCAAWSMAARRNMRISRNPTPTITQSRQARRISERLESVSRVASVSAAR